MTTTGLFLVSIVLVILTVFRIRNQRFAHSDFTKHLDALYEVLHIPTRLNEGRRLLTRARARLDATRLRAQQLRLRLQNRLALPEALTTSPQSYAALCLVSFLGESAVALLLNSTSQFGSMGDYTIAFVSPLLAAGMVVFAHFAIHGAVGVAAGHRPALQLRRARVATFALTSAALVGAWVVFAGRQAVSPVVVDFVANYGLHVLGIFVGLAGGAASTTYSILTEQQELEDEIRSLDAYAQELATFISDVESDIHAHAAIPKVGDGSSDASKRVKDLAVASLFGVGLLLCPRPALAQAANSQAGLRAPAAVRDLAKPRILRHSCEFLFDASNSEDSEARKTAISDLADQHLQVIIEEFHCEVVRASAFSGEAPFNVVREVIVPWPTTSPACVASDAAPRRAADVLYPRLRAAHQADALSTCEAERVKAHDAAIAVKNNAVAEARRLLRAVGAAPGVGACTSLVPAVDRALKRSEGVWAMTDGRQSCATPGGSSVSSSTGQSLFLLLLPTSGGLGSETARDAYALEAQLAEQFRGSQVFFYSEVTLTTWRSLR